MIIDKPELDTSFTSTGEKLYYHQEAMQSLRDGKGMPISAWCAPCDVCSHRCVFCSVGERPGDTLKWFQVKKFIDQLVPLGLKSITWSGGGNVLLWRDAEAGKDCNDLIDYAHGQGLECGMITNGLPLIEYPCGRKSWKTMRPETLDKLTWCRISMSGLDHNHKEQCVYVPDFDPSLCSLGFSWIMSDGYEEPTHKHGWVSTPEDVKTAGGKVIDAMERLPWIEEQIRMYVEKYKPVYCRFLANCLQPEMIPERHRILSEMAERINPQICFSQNKPPRQPKKKCYKVYTRPCLNACGTVFCCDSVVLNQTAGHKFGSQWGVCRWDEVGELFSKPIRQVIPDDICPGCVFPDQVDLIGEVVEDKIETPMPEKPVQHVNFI